MTSNHYSKKRNRREMIINKCIGDGNVIDVFEVDRGHRDGTELHSITDTGLIIIYNKRTSKLITKLIARPNQIARYYKNANKQPPDWLLQLAQHHKELGYNKDKYRGKNESIR